MLATRGSLLATMAVGSQLLACSAGSRQPLTLEDLRKKQEHRKEAAERDLRAAYVADLRRYLKEPGRAADRSDAYLELAGTLASGEETAALAEVATGYRRECPEGQDLWKILDLEFDGFLKSPKTLNQARGVLAELENALEKAPAKEKNELILVDKIALADAYTETSEVERARALLVEVAATTTAREDERVSLLVDSKLESMDEIGHEFKDFRAVDLTGHVVDTSKLRGKVVLIDFWATWCGSCRRAIPEVVELERSAREKGLVVIGVNLDDDRENVPDFVKEQGMAWPAVFDKLEDGKLLSDIYSVKAIPETILLDRSGRVFRRGLTGKALAAAVHGLL